MRLFIEIIAAFLAGFGLHQFYEPTQGLGERWGALARYGIGAIGVWPFTILIAHHFKGQVEDDTERMTMAYLLTLWAFGLGTFCGHLLDNDK